MEVPYGLNLIEESYFSKCKEKEFYEEVEKGKSGEGKLEFAGLKYKLRPVKF